MPVVLDKMKLPMRTLTRSLLLTSCLTSGLFASAQTVVNISGTVTPCGGATYPVHIQSNTVPPLDTTIYTGSNCAYAFTFFPVETQGTVTISTSCDGGISWTMAVGAWQPFLGDINVNLTCDTSAPPANDGCQAGTLIPVGTTCNPIPGTFANATQTFPAINCAGFVSTYALDVWYWFVATGTTTTVQATGDGNLDIVLEVYSDSCDMNSTIDCSDDTQEGGVEEVTLATQPGQAYYYRLYEWTPAIPASASTFTTCVTGNNSLFDCEGTPNGNAQPGTPCDDGDPNTVNDLWSPSCVCTGTAIPPCNACFTVSSPQPWVLEFTNCTNGGSAPYAYVWTFSDGSTSMMGDPTWTLVTPGEYIACLTITDANGCTSTTCDSVLIDSNGNIDPGFVPCTACVDAVPATNGPSGPAIPWTVFANNCSTGGPSQYSYDIAWGDGVNNGANPHVYSAPGTYTICITMTSTNGCTSVACDNVTIDASGTVDPASTNCNAAFWVIQAYTLDSLNPGTAIPIPNELWVYNLSTSGNMTANLVLTTTMGSTAATLTSGCSPGLVGASVSGPNIPGGTTITAVSCPTVTLSQPAISTGIVTHTFTGGTGGSYQFEWSWGDGTPNSTDAYPTHFYANGGPYNLCLTIVDGAGCTDTVCDSVSVDENGIYSGMITEENYARSGFTIRIVNPTNPTGIAERPTFEDARLWPNPVEELLNLTFNTTLRGSVPVNIIDLNGRVVKTLNTALTSGTNNLGISMNDLSEGMYLLRMGDNENAMSFRFVKR